MMNRSSKPKGPRSRRRSRVPLWLVETLDIVWLRRRLLLSTVVVVIAAGTAATLLVPEVVPTVPVVGAALGFAAVLLGLAVVIAVDAGDLVVRGPRHVRAAGGELVAILPAAPGPTSIDPLADAALDARSPDAMLVLAFATAGDDVTSTRRLTDEFAIAVARRDVSVLRADLAGGISAGPGLYEVMRDEIHLTRAVSFETDMKLAWIGPGRDVAGALAAVPELPSMLPSDLDVFVAAFPTATSKQVVRAAASLDHVLLVVRRDVTSRVDLIAALDALDAAGCVPQIVLFDDRSAQWLGMYNTASASVEPDDAAEAESAVEPEVEAEVESEAGVGPASEVSVDHAGVDEATSDAALEVAAEAERAVEPDVEAEVEAEVETDVEADVEVVSEALVGPGSEVSVDPAGVDEGTSDAALDVAAEAERAAQIGHSAEPGAPAEPPVAREPDPAAAVALDPDPGPEFERAPGLAPDDASVVTGHEQSDDAVALDSHRFDPQGAAAPTASPSLSRTGDEFALPPLPPLPAIGEVPAAGQGEQGAGRPETSTTETSVGESDGAAESPPEARSPDPPEPEPPHDLGGRDAVAPRDAEVLAGAAEAAAAAAVDASEVDDIATTEPEGPESLLDADEDHPTDEIEPIRLDEPAADPHRRRDTTQPNASEDAGSSRQPEFTVDPEASQGSGDPLLATTRMAAILEELEGRDERS